MKKELSLVSIGFLIVLLVLPLIHPAFATTIFSDGFESGDFSAWTGTNGSPTVQSAITHTGTYAMQCAVSGGSNIYAYKNHVAQTTHFVRVYSRIDTYPALNQYVTLLRVKKDSGVNNAGIVMFRNNNGTYQWYVFDASGIWRTIATPNPTVNTWYCIELKTVISATVGETRLYIDGVEIAAYTGLNSGTSGVDRIHLESWYSSTTTANVYHDCVVVADTYIGVEAGGEEYSRSASQSLTLSLAASKLFEVTRPVTQAIGLMLSGTKLFDITRLASQTIYFVLDMGRIAEYHVSVSQTVTATLNVQRLGEFLRTASQSIGLSLQAIAETIASYFRNVALTITTTLNANRLIEVTRQASQILNFLFNGERLIEVTRVASQTLNFVLQGFGSIVTEFERLATLALTFTHGIMGMYGAPVDYALVLACFAAVLAIIAIGWASTKKD